MKLSGRQTVLFQGKEYKGTVPDEIAKRVKLLPDEKTKSTSEKNTLRSDSGKFKSTG